MRRRAEPRRGWRWATVPGAIVMMSGSSPLSAQLLEYETDPTVQVPLSPPISTARSLFLRSSDVPVAQRALPAFSAHGMKLGAFDLYPALTIGTIFSSNLLANDDRRHATGGVLVRPEAVLRTSSGPYEVSIRGVGDFRRYASQTSENSEEGLVSARGSLAVGSLSSVFASVTYGSLIAPRYAADSPANAAEPLKYRALTGQAGGTFERGHIRIIVRGDATQLRYDDIKTTAGDPLFTKDRDRERYQGLARVEYALRPWLSVYTSGTVNKVDYQRGFGAAMIDRDSTGWGAFVGTSVALTHLLRGDVRVGYIRQNFRTPGVPPIAGLGALGKIEYFPTRLTTVTLTGESSVQDSGVPGTTGVLHRGGALRVDHELRRYLIASGEGGYFHDTYRGSARRDDLPYARASATYLAKDHWNVRLAYEFRKRACECGGFVNPFTDHRLLASLTAQY